MQVQASGCILDINVEPTKKYFILSFPKPAKRILRKLVRAKLNLFNSIIFK